MQVCVLVFYRKDVLNLIRKSEMFWKINSSDNPECKTLLQPVIWLLNVFGVLLFYIFMLFIPNCLYFHILLTKCWSTEGYKYLLMAFLQLLWLFGTLVTAFGFNCFFVGLCIQLAIQFKLLALRIESMGTSAVNTEEELQAMNEDMRSLVKYHLFLLE